MNDDRQMSKSFHEWRARVPFGPVGVDERAIAFSAWAVAWRAQEARIDFLTKALDQALYLAAPFPVLPSEFQELVAYQQEEK
jgi:hypothetical protein